MKVSIISFSGPLPKGAGVGGARGAAWRRQARCTWLALPHLLMFLGKKVRSRLWSQRRTDRDRRDLLGGCG